MGALNALQKSLRERGSSLLIVEGKAEDALPQLAAQYDATCIIAEEEVEFRYYLNIDIDRSSNCMCWQFRSCTSAESLKL